MRSLTAALASYLQGNEYLCVDLFEIDVGGVTYYLTNASQSVTGIAPATATAYTAANIDRDRVRASDGLQVDDLDVTVAHVGTEGLGALTWVELALSGALDHAPIRVYRGYLRPASLTLVGCYLRFAGLVTIADPGSTTIRLQAAVSADGFGSPVPGVAWQSKCIWTLGDLGCGWVGTIPYDVTIGAESRVNWFHIETMPGGLAPADFVGGTITVAGVARTVYYAGAAGDPFPIPHVDTGFVFVVVPGWLSLSQFVGDTATMRRGCDAAAATCDTIYSNLARYMGAPHAPVEP